MTEINSRPEPRAVDKYVPLISIVTVVLNGAETLEQAIESVLNQTCDKSEVELILIDGGSTDGTQAIIEKYAERIDYWVSEPDKGLFDAMNKGIEKSTGRLIGFLNADDWYEPDILQMVSDRFYGITEKPEDSVIYCDYISHDDQFQQGSQTKMKSELKYWRGMTVSHQAMFVHRGLFEKLGLYSQEYRFASDYEYFLRILKAGANFEKIDTYGVHFRKGGISTVNMNRSITEVSRIIRKYFGIISKEYPLFLLTNRLPSMLGNLRRILNKTIGERATNKLRKRWRKG
jgi:glycosyltransferase involved in cell wall biosynthesis